MSWLLQRGQGRILSGLLRDFSDSLSFSFSVSLSSPLMSVIVRPEGRLTEEDFVLPLDSTCDRERKINELATDLQFMIAVISNFGKA